MVWSSFHFSAARSLPGADRRCKKGEKDGPLDGKLKAAVFQQSGQNLVDWAGFPESLEDQSRTDPGAAGGNTLAPDVSAEARQLFREAPEWLDERIESAAGKKFVQASEAEQHALLHFAIDPLVIREQEISAGTVGLSANEQEALLCHQPYHINYAIILQYLSKLVGFRDTSISLRALSSSMDSTAYGYPGLSTVEDELH
jgi:hypothetical protein